MTTWIWWSRVTGAADPCLVVGSILLYGQRNVERSKTPVMKFNRISANFQGGSVLLRLLNSRILLGGIQCNFLEFCVIIILCVFILLMTI